MNERQLAITISLLLHFLIFFLLWFIRFGQISPVDLYEVVISPPQTPVPPPASVPPLPVIPPAAAPEPPVRPRPPAVSSRNEEVSSEEIPPTEEETVVLEETDQQFRERLRTYFRDQYIVKFEGDWAAFMDYDPESVILPRTTREELQAFLEGRLAEMALSPDEIEKVYPADDIVGEQLRRNQGVMPTVPLAGVPIAMLAQAAIELTRKAIGLFSKTPEPKEGLIALN